MKPRLLTFFLGLLIFCMFFGLIFQLPDLLNLSRRARLAEGLVIEARPEQHGSITVEAQLEGKTYRRDMGPYSLAVGQRVVVYYDAEKPSFFTVDAPRTILKIRALSSLACAAFLAGFLTLAAGAGVRGWAVALFSEPKLTLTLIATGSVIGFAGMLYFQKPSWKSVVAELPVSLGCVILLVQAYKSGLGWRGLIQSTPFRSGLVLLIAGEIAVVLV